VKVTKALVCIDHKWNMISRIYYETQIEYTIFNFNHNQSYISWMGSEFAIST